MHLVKDENGNVCAHAHSHTHSHADGCSQESCGECRGCGHEHSEASDKNAALLTYMYQHNQSHAAELDQMAEKLLKEGNDKAAEQIRKAVDEFQKGNMYLNLALAMVKDGQ